MAMSSSLSDLTQDLIINILSRLPVKSLLRVKSVSKPWRSLIQHRSFLDEYRDRIISNGSGRLLLVKHWDPDHCEHWLSFFSGEILEILPGLEIPPQICPPKTEYNLLLAGSCNGIICLCLGMSASLWNPATKQAVAIPNNSLTMTPRKIPDLRFMVYAFGYHPVIDDYKLIRVSYYSSYVNRNRTTESRSEVFSVKNWSWRELSVSGHYEISHSKRAIVDGVVYWVARKKLDDESSLKMVLSFDLGSELFEEIELPEEIDPDQGFLNLAVQERLLCLIDSSEIDQIWKYKEREWNKVVDRPKYLLWGIHGKRVLGFGIHGEIFVEKEYIYPYCSEPSDSKYGRLAVSERDGHVKTLPCIGSWRGLECDWHTESIVSVIRSDCQRNITYPQVRDQSIIINTEMVRPAYQRNITYLEVDDHSTDTESESCDELWDFPNKFCTKFFLGRFEPLTWDLEVLGIE